MTGGFLPRRLPLALVRLGRRFPRLALLAAFGAWVLTAFLVTRVQVDTDILSLVPRHNQVVQDFKTTIELFGSVDTLLVVVRIGENHELDPILAFADQLATGLRDWELIDWIEYRLENPIEAAVPLLDRATLFLSPAELQQLFDRLEPGRFAEEAEQLRARLMVPQSLFTKELVAIDPLGLLPRILERVRFGGVGAKVDPGTGCLIDPERTSLLMLAKPIRPAQDLAFDRELVAGLEDRVAEAAQRWRDEGWEGETPRVEFSGGYVIALEDSQLITADAVVQVVTSLIGVMLLFLLAFRRRATLLYAFIPLVTGLALTFAFVVLALGRLNSLTSAFGGLLIGLGIDFIIVLYGRYVEERQRGTSHEDAIDAMGRHTGVGVLLGAVTTAATFYSFLTTEFRGLWELGLLTGTGILLLVASVYVLLPALLTLLRKRHHGGKRLYLHSFGSDLLCRASLRRPNLTLALTLGVTVALGLAASGLEFDDDIQNMRSPDNRGIILRQELMKAFGLRFSPMTVRVDGATEAEVLAKAGRLYSRLEPIIDGHSLAGIDTIAGIVPPQERQEAVIARLEAEPIDLVGLAASLRDGLRHAGLNPAAFEEGVQHLIRSLEVRHPLTLSDLEGTALERMLGRYLVHHQGGVSTALYCYPPAGRWRRDTPPALVQLLANEPDVVLTGTNVVSAELRRIVWRDAANAALLGLVLVFLLLWADLGTPTRSILALVPLLCGLAWMLGAMALLGARVNFMNIFVLTMVIGIGVDYGVHLLHRWLESGGVGDPLAETAKAIAVAALTTMVGFGSLILSHYPGLRSVGLAAILGAASTAILSITLLPVLLTRITLRSVPHRDEGREEQC